MSETVTSGGVTYYQYQPTNPPPYTAGPPTQPGQAVMAGTTFVPVVVGPSVGPKPQSFNCSHCNNDVVTRIRFKPALRTHLFAAALCVFGCWPCVCVPYCVETCNNVEHYCPNCGVFLGTYKH